MSSKPTFHWDDVLLLREQLTEEERMVWDAATAYAQEQLKPRVLNAFRNESTDPEIFREMGALGLHGMTVAGMCDHMDHALMGLHRLRCRG